jgi:hypothetical protein
MYDVNVESKLVAQLKDITLKTTFSELRIDFQRVTRRLNALGWTLSERFLVIWAGLAMNKAHWATIQREKPKTLAEMQRLQNELRLEERRLQE